MGWEEIIGMVVGTVLSFLASFLEKFPSHVKSILIAVAAFLIGVGFYLAVPELRDQYQFVQILYWALAALGTGGFLYSAQKAARKKAGKAK